MKRVVWYPTFRCNKSCPYCYEKEFPMMLEHHWEEWLEEFKKQDDLLIDISGGEPFMYYDLVKTILLMPKRHKVALTTNLSYMTQLERLKGRLYAVTASYHPYSESFTRFVNKVKQIQKYMRMRIMVNIVAYPAVLNRLEEYSNVLRESGIKFHIEPYVHPLRPYTNDEREQLLTNRIEGRRLGWDPFVDREAKVCKAGIEQQHWVANGDVYACGTYLMLYQLGRVLKDDRYLLGNLFDGSYSEPLGPIMCTLPCTVGCDMDFHNDIWELKK